MKKLTKTQQPRRWISKMNLATTIQIKFIPNKNDFFGTTIAFYSNSFIIFSTKDIAKSSKPAWRSFS
jgi:hypothetical protein